MITAIVSCYPTFSVRTQPRHRQPASQTKALDLSVEDRKPSCVFLVADVLKQLVTETSLGLLLHFTFPPINQSIRYVT